MEGLAHQTIDQADMSPPRSLASKVALVLEHTAAHYNVKVADLRSTGKGSKRACIVTPRHVAMHMLRELLKMDFQEIARTLHRANHTTVIAALRSVADRCSCDRAYDADVKRIQKHLQQALGMAQRDDSHLMACPAFAGPIGSPGCICVVVSRNTLKTWADRCERVMAHLAISTGATMETLIDLAKTRDAINQLLSEAPFSVGHEHPTA